MNRLFKSLEARVKNLKVRYWWFTRHGMVFRKLKGKYAGERCFIIGNGPSLRAEDLDQLVNEYTFGFNRVYKVFNKTLWRPTFFCSEDPKVLAGCLDEVSQLDLKYKFIPYPLALWYGQKARGATYFLLNQKSLAPNAGHFSPDAENGFNWGNTVAYTAMQMAVYMGFTEIYLLGIDHSFSTSLNTKGELVVDPSAKDYFDNSYNADKASLYIPTPEHSTIAYRAARAYADQHGIKILNATRGGKLEVFERVDFDSLFSNKKKSNG